MKDLVLFIKKNIIQFVILVAILSTAGIMLADSYVYDGIPNTVLDAYWLEADQVDDYTTVIYVTDVNGEILFMLDDNLYSHLPSEHWTDYNLNQLYDYIERFRGDTDLHNLTADYHECMRQLEQGNLKPIL